VSVSKNIWNCFSECKHGGNTLDFIARMEHVTIHAAALKAVEWFRIDADTPVPNGAAAATMRTVAGQSDGETDRGPHRRKNAHSPPATSQKQVTTPESSSPNKPLKFRLDKLDRNHPSLAERGLTFETIVDFGIGYCAKGMMAERIAIPIHNSEGAVVAYAGRVPGEPGGDVPKYKLPPGFKKSLELFNVDRAFKEPAEQPLIIVEGFFDCMKLHQHGYRKVVALMGSTMSPAQEALIQQHTGSESRIIVMLDEDEAGQLGRDEIAVRLAKSAFVKVHRFEKPGTQPDQLSADEIQELLGGVA
jgi:DNA primase